MTGSGLRTSLIKSGVLLVVLSLLVYLTAHSPDGSLWASLGTLFVAVFRIIQLSIGLVISLLFCLAVLTGIFFGGVAMVSRESATHMWNLLCQKISDRLLWVRTMIVRDEPAQGNVHFENYSEALKQEVLKKIESVSHNQKLEQAAVNEKITNLVQRVADVENNLAMESVQNQVSQHDKSIREVSDLLVSMQTNLAQMNQQINEAASVKDIEEFSANLGKLSQQIQELQQANTLVQAELLEVKKNRDQEEEKNKETSISTAGPAEHRLFAYMTSKVMQERVAELVTETLGKSMSYAQVVNHLTKQTSGKTAEIIRAHPKLVKNYIRYRREKG